MTIDDTKLGQYATKTLASSHPGESGFQVLDDGIEAFVARAALIESAEKSLDLQYYIYQGDTTGKLITLALLRAADRGVRVRMILDDLGKTAEDKNIAIIATHPNIDIRIFNPTYNRSGLAKIFELLRTFKRINHRMHNKLLVADSCALITGGRNIGDEYFSITNMHFKDVDVLGLGPVAKLGSEDFEIYWNSNLAIPVEQFKIKTGFSEYQQLHETLKTFLDTQRESEFVQAFKNSSFIRHMNEDAIPFYLARGILYSDPPQKAGNHQAVAQSNYLGHQLGLLAEKCTQQLLISSAYFIPGKKGSQFFMQRETDGVSVKILTNSLAATDVAVVHSGYKRYRKKLLRAGIKLWEMHTKGEQSSRQKWFRGSSKASLHAKTLVFDYDAVFIGTINLDARSVVQNTEVGLYIQSREIADHVANLFALWTSPSHAYSVQLDKSGADIQWVGEVNNEPIILSVEPETSWWQRFKVSLLSLLPLESQI